MTHNCDDSFKQARPTCRKYVEPSAVEGCEATHPTNGAIVTRRCRRDRAETDKKVLGARNSVATENRQPHTKFQVTCITHYRMPISNNANNAGKFHSDLEGPNTPKVLQMSFENGPKLGNRAIATTTNMFCAIPCS